MTDRMPLPERGRQYSDRIIKNLQTMFDNVPHAERKAAMTHVCVYCETLKRGLNTESVDSSKSYPKRTNQQNRAIHLFVKMLSDAMLAEGIDMRTFLKEGVAIDPSPEIVMNNIWRPVQKALFDTDSTKDLNTAQVSQVYEALAPALARQGIVVEFPSLEPPLLPPENNA